MADQNIDQDDVEGNMPLRKVEDGLEPEKDDSEGNGIRVRTVKDGIEPEGDDTEGNGIRVRT